MSNIDPQNDLALTNAPIWRFLRRLVIIFFIVIPVLILLGRWGWKELVHRSNKNRVEWQLKFMKERKKSNIEFYSTDYTDQALQHLRGNAEVEYIAFNLTDLSDQGLAALATLPNLKGLLLYGSAVTNNGLEQLQKLPKLERLILKNTKITDNGLLILQRIPQIKHLALFDDRHGGPLLTDQALVNLAQLRQLTTLEIGGSWMNDEAIKKLKTALPSCAISRYSTCERFFVFESD